MRDPEDFHSCAFCRQQAGKLEEANERIRQLEALIFGRAWEPPASFRLTRMEADILRALMASGRICTHDHLIEASRGVSSRKDDPQPKVIDTKICHMREKLRPFGIVIDTIYSQGFRLSAESRARLLNWQDQEAA